MSESLDYMKYQLSETEIPHLNFTKTWESAADFPQYEPSEMQVRKDMQCLHDEAKNYINDELIPAVEETFGIVSTLFEKNDETVAQIQRDLDDRVTDAELAQKLRETELGQIHDGTITEAKLSQEVLDRSYTKEETDVRFERAYSVGDLKSTVRNDLGENWLLCNGAPIDAEAYPELYAATEFSINNSLVEKELPPIGETDVILAPYTDEDCLVFAVSNTAGTTVTMWWKRRSETEWHSQLVYTKTTSNHKATDAKISLANGNLCALIIDDYSASTESYAYPYYTYCSKDTFAWAEAAMVAASTVKIHTDRGFTPIRYLNGNYVFSAYYIGTSNNLVYLFYVDELSAGKFSKGSGSGSGYTGPIDVTYTDGCWRILCGGGTSYANMRVLYTDAISSSSNFNSMGATGATDGGTNFAPNTAYWASNKDTGDGNVVLLNGVTIVAELPFQFSPVAIDMVGNDVYIIGDSGSIKYNLETKDYEYSAIKFAAKPLKRAANKPVITADFAKQIVSVYSDKVYYEAEKALPRISNDGAKTYIKAKM